ncbi:MAG: hypothetical protein ACD_2C00107G0008 [uncultured bacterium (gcode 4)]|uniref:Uncharacterized protein n=1 Tax=uncultured bacterium (gcode 4) TaxID=1234023 RepID=K2G3G0_9BACT|nr:MAG: hypothetical protein ACD_2C00107G0008 [uncultured bacterium (gcode 4)]
MTILNFRSLYEKIFSSFDVAADTKLVEGFEKEWVEKLIIIKRSWVFAIFNSWIFLLVMIIMVSNSILISYNFENKVTATILIWLLVFNILFWIISVIIYFRKFKNIYWDRPRITDTKSLKEELINWDIVFTKFFNRTIFNYFILIWITVFIVYDLIFWNQGFENVWMYWLINIALLFLQVFLSAVFKNRMVNLEMDFSLVMPWKIIFYNQSWLLRNVQTINSEKIKTITSSFGNFIGSIFNFWEIVVMTEWDEANMWEMHLYYISHPTETVHEINTILWAPEKEPIAAVGVFKPGNQ